MKAQCICVSAVQDDVAKQKAKEKYDKTWDFLQGGCKLKKEVSPVLPLFSPFLFPSSCRRRDYLLGVFRCFAIIERVSSTQQSHNANCVYFDVNLLFDNVMQRRGCRQI